MNESHAQGPASATVRMYQRTGIGRPLDMRYPTNRAVAILAPLAGVIAAIVTALEALQPIPMLTAGIAGAAATFGAWALTRELAPDNNPAAFISMALAFAALLIVESASVLVLFATMLLMRIVNRSVGLPARASDSILVVGFTTLTVYVTRSPHIGAVGTLAFVLDSALPHPHRRQMIFAALSLVATAIVIIARELDILASSVLTATTAWLIAIIGSTYALTMLLSRRVQSVGDATGAPLSVHRVRAGMLIALITALLTSMYSEGGFESAALLWATLAGVVLGELGKRVILISRGSDR